MLRGNVLDLAAAVVTGAAFGAVVTALVKDLITPLLAAIFAKPDPLAIAFTVNRSKFPIGNFILGRQWAHRKAAHRADPLSQGIRGRALHLARAGDRQTKESSYDTLYRASQGWHESAHDAMPPVGYFLSVARAAYDEFARDLGELRDGNGMKTQLVLLAIGRMIGDFSAPELHQRCPSVGVDMLRHVLRSARDAGRLQVVGHGRGARWRKVPVAGNG